MHIRSAAARRARRRLVALVGGASIILALGGCARLERLILNDYYTAFMWMTLNRGDLWVRANTCDEQHLVSAFVLGSEDDPAQQVWEIKPDDAASVRLGSRDEIAALVDAGLTRLSITGVRGDVLTLDLADGRLASLTETATPDENTLLVSTPHGTKLVTDYSFIPDEALRTICAPPEPDESRDHSESD